MFRPRWRVHRLPSRREAGVDVGVRRHRARLGDAVAVRIKRNEDKYVIVSTIGESNGTYENAF